MARLVLVTGGGGFIGQALVRRLLASSGYSVTVLTRRPIAGLAAGERHPAEVIGDLLDPSAYRKQLEACDVVVHLAAATGRAAPAEYRRINVEGTRALLEACKAARVRKLLYMSTIAAAYADQRYYPYAKTKSEAEALVRDSGLEHAIVRPTIVLGAGSPIWSTLLKIARLPVIPLPEGRRPVMVAPVHVDDVARAVEIVLESDRFDGQVLEVGGPDALPFRELLQLVQGALHGKPGRIVKVPLGPIRALLAAMEPVARPLMPVTAGQLAVFANDSVPAESWLLARMRPEMPSTSETIATLLEPAAGNKPGGPSVRPQPPSDPPQPLSTDARRVLEKECRSFGAYLVGIVPNDYVAEQYLAALSAHGLAADDGISSFDRATLGLARMRPMFARWADAYCAIFARRGILRRKLIVLAAILEHVAPTSEAFDRVEPRSVARTVAALAGHGTVFAMSLLLGAMLLLPAYALRRLAGRAPSAGLPAGPAK